MKFFIKCKNKEITKTLDQIRKESTYEDSSVMNEYKEYLLKNNIHYTHNQKELWSRLKGKRNLGETMLGFYNKAIGDDDKLCILRDLIETGYNKDIIVEVILKVFKENKSNERLWEYGDLLYLLKNKKYVNCYISIACDSSYKESRQMIVLLLGVIKNEKVIPVLISLLEDETVDYHALLALTKYKSNEVINVMELYKNHALSSYRKVAINYLKKFRGNNR